MACSLGQGTPSNGLSATDLLLLLSKSRWACPAHFSILRRAAVLALLCLAASFAAGAQNPQPSQFAAAKQNSRPAQENQNSRAPETSQAPQAASLSEPLIDSKSLAAGWRSSEGDDLGWAQPDFDDSAWEAFPRTDALPPQNEVRWFRRQLRVNPSWPMEGVAISVELRGSLQLFVNGRLALNLGSLLAPDGKKMDFGSRFARIRPAGPRGRPACRAVPGAPSRRLRLDNAHERLSLADRRSRRDRREGPKERTCHLRSPVALHRLVRRPGTAPRSPFPLLARHSLQPLLLAHRDGVGAPCWTPA